MREIVVLDGHALNPGDLSWQALEKLGQFTVYDRTEPEDTIARIGKAEIILTNKTIIDETVLKACPSLRYIGILATGANIVDLEATKRRGIVVTNVPAYSTYSVAQLVFALLLEATTHVGEHAAIVRQGGWATSKDFCFWKYPIWELAEKTMGIIGLGAIGQAVAQIAQAMGMKVLAYSRTAKQVQGVTQVPFETLLASSHVVSLHCPLTQETQQMFNEKSLAKMRPGSILINTGRGALVDEQAVAAALDSGRLAYYLGDVLCQEPPLPDHCLANHPKCILTPHIGWATYEARVRLMKEAIENLRSWLAGVVRNQVNS